jgi:hypothetical protein
VRIAHPDEKGKAARSGIQSLLPYHEWETIFTTRELRFGL